MSHPTVRVVAAAAAGVAVGYVAAVWLRRRQVPASEAPAEAPRIVDAAAADDAPPAPTDAAVIEAVARIATPRPLPSPSLLGRLCARVTLGTKPHQFQCLQRNWHVKKLAWVVGADGIEMLLRAGPTIGMLKLGFQAKWVRARVEQGFKFKLALFPAEAVQARPATWEGVFEAVRLHYPADIARLVLRYKRELTTLSFEDIERAASKGFLKGSTFFGVNETGKNGEVRRGRSRPLLVALAASTPR